MCWLHVCNYERVLRMVVRLPCFVHVDIFVVHAVWCLLLLLVEIEMIVEIIMALVLLLLYFILYSFSGAAVYNDILL